MARRLLVFLCTFCSHVAFSQSGAPAPVATPVTIEPRSPARAGQPRGAFHPLLSEVERYALDGRSLLTAPARWTLGEWSAAAAAGVGIVLLSEADEGVSRWVNENRSAGTIRVSRAVTPLGEYGALGISVIALGGGLALGKEDWKAAGRDAIEAQIFAAGVVTPLLKLATGRARPAQSPESDAFAPFSSRSSFPSGHTTEVFAVASVIAAHSDGWLVPTLAYTLASSVGFARIHDGAHHLTDVVAGALIGTLIGHAVVRLNRPRESTDSEPILFEPSVLTARQGAGVGLRLSF